jgi:hypothetical protein
MVEHIAEILIDRKATLARLQRDTETGIRLNEHITEDGSTVFAHACQLGAEGIASKKVNGAYQSGPCASGSRSAIPSASPCNGSRVAIGIAESEPATIGRLD